MSYGGSNGHVNDDVTWSRKVKLVTPTSLERNISNSQRCYLALAIAIIAK